MNEKTEPAAGGDNRTPDKTIGQIEYASGSAKPKPASEPLKSHGDKYQQKG